MSEEHKAYASTAAATLEAHILSVHSAKSEAEWWAQREIERLRAENEKLRGDVKTAVFADSAELKDVKRYNEELLGLLREAWVKMESNNLWSNLRARVAAALKETGDD